MGRRSPVSICIQFDGRTQPAWPLQLKALGVELLRYVPEDAFVAYVENSQLEQIAALDFVRWVGRIVRNTSWSRECANGPNRDQQKLSLSRW